MDNFDKGMLLEDIYKKKLMSQMKLPMSNREALATDIMRIGTDDELGLYEKKPVYEEIRKIPIEDQIKMMMDRQETLPISLEPEQIEDPRSQQIRRMFPLYKGQKLG